MNPNNTLLGFPIIEGDFVQFGIKTEDLTEAFEIKPTIIRVKPVSYMIDKGIRILGITIKRPKFMATFTVIHEQEAADD